jgi:hypothetical protein
MATKIISKSTDWNPVKIEINFETRDQLALFVEVMGMSNQIMELITSPDVQADLSCRMIENLTPFEIEDAINGIVDMSTWNELKMIVNNC